MNIPVSEQETNLNMSGDDRSTWHVFTDDSVMQRKLEKVGAVVTRVAKDGVGKFYTLRADQVVLRIGKRELSDERKAQLATRMRALRNPTGIHVAVEPRIDASEVAR